MRRTIGGLLLRELRHDAMIWSMTAFESFGFDSCTFPPPSQLRFFVSSSSFDALAPWHVVPRLTDVDSGRTTKAIGARGLLLAPESFRRSLPPARAWMIFRAAPMLWRLDSLLRLLERNEALERNEILAVKDSSEWLLRQASEICR